jgi:uncharacterized protein YutE (UPF0331/DUF86 family)
MADYLGELELLQNLSVDEILDDVFKYRAAERLQELIIQTSLDINRHLLTEVHQITPETNADVFLESGRVGLLPQELAKRLVEAGKFRNLLAHQYEKIDARIVVQNIQLTLMDYPIYLDFLNRYLNTLEDNHDTES